MPLRFQPARGASVLLSSSSRGPTGVTGSTGATGATGATVGVQFTYSTTTTDSDPGSGVFRLNHATIASATAAYIDNLASDGNTASTWIDTFDDSTNTAKGTLVIRGVTTQSAWGVFDVTGSVTDETGYRKLTLTCVASGGTWTNGETFAFNFSRSGDKGADGAGTGDVVGPSSSVDGEIVLYNSTTGKLIKRASTTGILKATSGVLSAAVSATDYAPATSGSAILKGNGSGGFSSAAAGTDYCGATSGSSILKGSSGNTTAATAGTDFMHPGTTSLVTKGFTLTPYSQSWASNFTVDPSQGNYQYATNDAARTITAPASDCAVDMLITNHATTAGSITFSGFTVGSSTGSTYATTGNNKYLLSIRRINGTSTYSWYALQ